MRTKYSLINMFVGLGGQIVNIFLAFIGRLIFVHYLSAEYLGVNGLFTNILGMLNLAELGISTAMIYSLYKPVAEDDKDKIGRLMNLYKFLYRCVAGVVFFLGVVLFPFLDYFIKGNSGVEHLRFIYLMYLSNSVASYFLSYKNSVLIASQRSYIQAAYEQLLHFVQLILQIAFLIMTGNFILYLTIQLISQFMVNVLISVKVNKEYPYLRNARSLPSRQECKEIIKNICAMSMHKFGTVFVKGTDNLLMSAFIGLRSVGIYSNYKLILSNLNTLLNQINSAFTGSIGNLSATEEPDKVYEVFCILDFSIFLIYGYFASGMAVLFNPFIELFFGKDYIFTEFVVILMVADFYLTGMRQMVMQFRNVMGLFWYDRYKPVAEVMINLVVSVMLARKYGVSGIFIGTIVSCILTCLWVEPYVLMRYGIKNEWKKRLAVYFGQYAFRVFTVILGGVLGQWCTRWIPCSNIMMFLLKGILYSVVYAGVMWIVYGRGKEFQYLYVRGKDIFRKVCSDKRHR